MRANRGKAKACNFHNGPRTFLSAMNYGMLDHSREVDYGALHK